MLNSQRVKQISIFKGQLCHGSGIICILIKFPWPLGLKYHHTPFTIPRNCLILWEINGCPDLCTLYFKEEFLFMYDILFIHKENWCP